MIKSYSFWGNALRQWIYFYCSSHNYKNKNHPILNHLRSLYFDIEKDGQMFVLPAYSANTLPAVPGFAYPKTFLFNNREYKTFYRSYKGSIRSFLHWLKTHNLIQSYKKQGKYYQVVPNSQDLILESLKKNRDEAMLRVVRRNNKTSKVLKAKFHNIGIAERFRYFCTVKCFKKSIYYFRLNQANSKYIRRLENRYLSTIMNCKDYGAVPPTAKQIFRINKRTCHLFPN